MELMKEAEDGDRTPENGVVMMEVEE